MRFFNKNVLLLILFAMIFCTGCHYGYEPLSSEKADAFLKSNSEDIDVIVEYLKELEYDSAVIDKNNGTIFFEYEYHKIMSNDVNNSIRHVWSNGCERIRMYKEDNTISFEIWSRSIRDVGYGISCTIDGQGCPKVQFQTECESISDGWFYYYTDYEEYRSNSSK